MVGGNSVDIFLAASDPDFEELTYTVGNPLHGVLTGTAPNLTYTPTAGYVGPDSFTFSVNDGQATSNTATVTITVIRGLHDDRRVALSKATQGRTSSHSSSLWPRQSAGEVTVHAATGDDSAVAPDDYLTREQDLVFPSRCDDARNSLCRSSETQPPSPTRRSSVDPVGSQWRGHRRSERDGHRSSTTTGRAISASIGPLTRIQGEPGSQTVRSTMSPTSEPEFFGDTACGTFLVVDGVLYGPSSIPAGGAAAPLTPWTPVSQTPTTGSGTSADPWTIVTIVDAGTTGIRLTQTDTYVEGSESYRTTVSIASSAGSGEDDAPLPCCRLLPAELRPGLRRHRPGERGCCVAALPTTREPRGSRIIEWFPLHRAAPHTSRLQRGLGADRFAAALPEHLSVRPVHRQRRWPQLVGRGAGWRLGDARSSDHVLSDRTPAADDGQDRRRRGIRGRRHERLHDHSRRTPTRPARRSPRSATRCLRASRMSRDQRPGATTSNPTIVGQVLTWAGPSHGARGGLDRAGLRRDRLRRRRAVLQRGDGRRRHGRSRRNRTDRLDHRDRQRAAGWSTPASTSPRVILEGASVSARRHHHERARLRHPDHDVVVRPGQRRRCWATCAFVDPSAVDTSVTCTDDGVYELTLTADDGANTRSPTASS